MRPGLVKIRKGRVYFLFVGILFAASCVTGGKVEKHIPSWFQSLKESLQGDCRIVKVTSQGGEPQEVVRLGAEQLADKIFTLCQAKELSEDSEGRRLLVHAVSPLVDGAVSTLLDGQLSLYRQETLLVGEQSFYYGAFCLKPEASEALKAFFMKVFYGNSTKVGLCLEEAVRLQEKGRQYAGAEQLLRGAVLAMEGGKPLARETAQGYIHRSAALLAPIRVRMTSFPKTALADRKIKAASLFCGIEKPEETGSPGVEFLVQYQGRKRDGTSGLFERRLVSDSAGKVEFFHPFVSRVGDSPVFFAGGGRQLRGDTGFLEKEGLDVSGIREWMDTSSFSEKIEIRSSAKITSIGIVVLQNDMAGKSLPRQEVAESIRDTLSQEGYQVTLLPLDPEEIRNNAEADFLRKTSVLYKAAQRILFGIVNLRDFEEREGSFRVETAGWLKLADQLRGEVILDLHQAKSVESRSDGQAVSTSFHELGKAFALDIMDSLE